MGDLAVFVDPITLLRDQLRTLDLANTVGQRVWAGGLPNAGENPDLPAVVVRRLPGGFVDGPLEHVDLQFDVWSATTPASASIAGALVTWLVTAGRVELGVIDDCTVSLLGVDEQTLTNGHVPDPSDPKYQRYLVTCRGVFAAKPNP